MATLIPAIASAGILNHAKAQHLRNRDNRAEELAFGMLGGKIPSRGRRGDSRQALRDWFTSGKRGRLMAGNVSKWAKEPRQPEGPIGHMRKIQPGPRIDMMENIGRQRVDYGRGDSMLQKFHPASMTGAVGEHAMLGRRLHSGDLNMINRRRRVQPRQMGGPERLSYRNTQPNRGTYGVGQGFDR